MGIRTLLRLFFVVALVGAGCGGSGDEPAAGPTSTVTASTSTVTVSSTTSEAPMAMDYRERGPYAVGVIDLVLGGREVPDRVVYVYYPSDAAEGEAWSYSSLDAFDESIRGFLPEILLNEFEFDAVWSAAPAAAGPFDVAVYSHGFGGFPTDNSSLMTHLASWGYVVIAPDHWERDRMSTTGLREVERSEDQDTSDLIDAVALVRGEAGTAGSPIEGAIDETSSLVGVGLSAGGRAVMDAAESGDLEAWVGWAPVLGSAEIDAPGLIIAADRDVAISLTDVTDHVASASPAVALAVLQNAGHNTFTDSCPEIRARGGLVQFADSIGVDPGLLELGDNGCLEEFTDAAEFWPMIGHLTVAHLQAALGSDDGSSLAAPFVDGLVEGLLATYQVGQFG
jgi:predicted dienelactone hydrolase